MALKAGYKGFKKLLSPLKLFRPGELGIDNEALVADLNAVFFPRSEQAVLGAKNGFNSENAVKATEFVSANNNGIISFKDVSTAQWSSTYIGYFDVNAGQTYLLTGTNAAPYGRFALGLSATNHPADAYVPHITVISGTSNVQSFGLQNPVKYTANATERIYLWYCSDVNVESHTTFSTGIMNRFASDTDDIFAPYAMTNKELTDAISNISSGWDYSTSEVDTGQKWIDGRPIYCKVIALENAISTTAGSWTSTGVSSAGVDVLLNISSAGDACTNLRGANKVSTTEEFHIQAYYGTVSVSTVIVYYLKAANREVIPEEEPVKKTTRKKSTASADINE